MYIYIHISWLGLAWFDRLRAHRVVCLSSSIDKKIEGRKKERKSKEESCQAELEPKTSSLPGCDLVRSISVFLSLQTHARTPDLFVTAIEKHHNRSCSCKSWQAHLNCIHIYAGSIVSERLDLWISPPGFPNRVRSVWLALRRWKETSSSDDRSGEGLSVDDFQATW